MPYSGERHGAVERHHDMTGAAIDLPDRGCTPTD
jgi:hypothetical protein